MNLRSVFFPIFVSLPALSLSAWGCSSSSYSSPGEGAGGEGPVEGPEDEAEEDPSDGPTPVVVIGGASGNGEKCEVGAVDVPDAEQIDENCDGIDGTIDGAIFVSPLGSDEDDGSMTWPVATLTEAVTRATAEGKDVYACSATYEENLVIAEGVRIYGGFACEDEWKRTKTPAEVAPQEGLPLSIEDLEEGANPTVIENFLFRAKDASEEGQSSIAGRVVRSHGVELSRVEFIAGKGADAAAAEAAPAFAKPAAAGKDGADPQFVWEAMFGDGCYSESTSHCSGGGLCVPETTWNPVCRNRTGLQPMAWRCSGTCTATCETDGGMQVTVARGNGGHGSTGFTSPKKSPGTGKRRSDPSGAAQNGIAGTAAKAGFGEVDESGNYVASNVGALGKFGGVGKSGRGGDGAPHTGGDFLPQVGGAGGSSGMPGCGGFPGQGGLAGGGSIGLIVVDSQVLLERVTMVTASGGAGGSASRGAEGQVGGAGGKGGVSHNRNGTYKSNSIYGGKNGQKGGNGGRGGDGGAGGGGPSVGIVVIGDEPSLKAMSFDIGLGGEGGLPLEGSSAGKGAAGISEDVYIVGGE